MQIMIYLYCRLEINQLNLPQRTIPTLLMANLNKIRETLDNNGKENFVDGKVFKINCK